MFNTNSDDRGQVGIGTLIVFIAMVLVAAIAAGVLINTAGFLQSQAQATGEESSSQVTDRVQVISVVGNALDGEVDSSVDQLEVTTMRSPGAEDIDLSDAIVEVFVEGETDTLSHGEALDSTDSKNFPDNTGADAEEQFNTFLINGDDDSPAVLSQNSDRIALLIELGDGDGENGAAQAIGEGDTLTLTVTTSSGAVTETTVRAPESIDDDGDDQSIRL